MVRLITTLIIIIYLFICPSLVVTQIQTSINCQYNLKIRPIVIWQLLIFKNYTVQDLNVYPCCISEQNMVQYDCDYGRGLDWYLDLFNTYRS
jgi:hypothetical protein